jgi:CRP-like cAMP-binding protein
LTDCSIIAFPAESFIALLHEHEILHTKFLTDTAERFAEKNKSQEPANKRLARMLRKFCDGRETFDLKASPKQLGDQIGTTRQTVHDILIGFTKIGLVSKVGYGTYRLHRSPLETFLDVHGDDE